MTALYRRTPASGFIKLLSIMALVLTVVTLTGTADRPRSAVGSATPATAPTTTNRPSPAGGGLPWG
jgi:hypothetical protein